MNGRLKGLGVVLVLIGFAFIAGGGYAYLRTQDGAKSLQAFSAAQNVKLSYNDQGQLVDRGETAGAQAIMSLLTNDWGYTVSSSELNPNDPLVNTASEYMFQMATIAYHTLHSTQTVVLPADVTAADGTIYKAGEYEFKVDGRYWSAFDRANPIEAAAREKAWTGTAHALIAELGVGASTASALQMGLGLAALFAALGATIVLTGFGLVWATRVETAKVPALRQAPIPA
ncbi:MAG TPA: hypothetical protein VGQ64_10985 [Candidatus Limnocylindrales bacterium]|jgi:hypothetical protein|nr:hypothetical protein [Candidatus Limnocylindrales bacterium]